MDLVTKTLSFRAGTADLAGFLARPPGDGPFSSVVVIHEAYGLNENIRDVARRFAEVGYLAFAVDLFAGRNRAICLARFMAGLLVGSPNRYGIADLKATLSFLADRPDVDAEHLGAIGFCMGGSLAIAWACTDNRLKAIAPFYALNPRPREAIARSCPVVGSYPERDFTAGAGRTLQATLDRFAVPNDVKVYPGAKHSFFNDRGASYNKTAAEDSWRRVLAFFGERLGAPGEPGLA
jgi:carboxymethylenebutenolidase